MDDALNDKKKNDVEYFYSTINPDIEKTFSHEQRQEVKHAILRAVKIPSKKIVDYRTTFWFIKRLYLVIFIGKDIRRKGRADSTITPTVVRYVIFMILTLFTLFVIMIFIFFILYLIKSFAGINIFENYHLSDFIRKINELFA